MTTPNPSPSITRPILQGLRLRCPHCEQAHMFNGLFDIKPKCPNCGVVFERSEGESLGGAMLSLVIAEILSIGGFFLTHWLFEPPMVAQLIFWILFNLIFIVLFSRHGRGMWIGIIYLTGGVYADDNDESAEEEGH